MNNCNKLKPILAILVFLTPLKAFAHGEEFFTTVFIELTLLAVFIAILVFMKIRIEGKLIIGGLYLLATYLVFKQIDNLPYRQNVIFINVLVLVIPSTVFLVSYLALRKRFKKVD